MGAALGVDDEVFEQPALHVHLAGEGNGQRLLIEPHFADLKDAGGDLADGGLGRLLGFRGSRRFLRERREGEREAGEQGRGGTLERNHSHHLNPSGGYALGMKIEIKMKITRGKMGDYLRMSTGSSQRPEPVAVVGKPASTRSEMLRTGPSGARSGVGLSLEESGALRVIGRPSA